MTLLVESGETWKYLDDGMDQGTAWREPAFDDSLWLSDVAELGYGDGNETTVVSYGDDENDKHVTTYFRRAFDIADPSSIEALEVLP